MKALDRFLQRWRFRVAERQLPDGVRLLDIGCHEGELLQRLGDRAGSSTGIDPALGSDCSLGQHELLAGGYPERRPSTPPLGAATLLAVVEHLTEDQLTATGHALAEDVEPNGVIVVTVPAPIVDRIVDVLAKLRLIDGMDLDAHHAFDVRRLPVVWSDAGLDLVVRKRFQLGLNNLFVFRVRNRSG